ncbi:MAG: YdcF family protein [Deltaproteobacteria bacterium]|nr:YdcF family protein [Deltaproteobacteria bacterium]
MIKRKSRYIAALSIICIVILLYVFSGGILASLGNFLVVDEKPVHSDAVVVLNTGVEYHPRLEEAASLYRKGFAEKIVINGNRKTDALRELERRGLKHCCPWYEERFRILELLGVRRSDIIAISVEDAYDTISEAQAVGGELIKAGIDSIIIATSKSHTGRALSIWKNLFAGRFKLKVVAAQKDPYSPRGWWKDGRQIRWVMSEYGAWLYYFWKSRINGLKDGIIERRDGDDNP